MGLNCIDTLTALFADLAPPVEFCSLRYVHDVWESIGVRRWALQPLGSWSDEGVMITVVDDGGYGYAATGDLSRDGIYLAIRDARVWAEACRGRLTLDVAAIPRPGVTGSYETSVRVPWTSTTVNEKAEFLLSVAESLRRDDRIINGDVSLVRFDTESLLLTSEGGHVRQSFRRVLPALTVTAAEGSDVQTRSLDGSRACARQGGLEILDELRLRERAPELADAALELLAAPRCPSDSRDLLIGPAQMILQVHESIGHPLELDRVIGDERNYAGTTFVKASDFGHLQYGSSHLNVVFDPASQGEFSSYGFDDDGTPAQREYLIRDGVLVRGLGGTCSEARLGVPGVACARASSWNRPPIDRMANLNMEPGRHTMDDMVSSVERGVLMDVNTSWSIDDSRNKFQFSCEWGRLIENGELTTLVKNPGYRGISTTFWNSLDMVGDSTTRKMLGTANCGKGEPNQRIGTGHSVPAGLFRNVEVFGGD